MDIFKVTPRVLAMFALTIALNALRQQLTVIPVLARIEWMLQIAIAGKDFMMMVELIANNVIINAKRAILLVAPAASKVELIILIVIALRDSMIMELQHVKLAIAIATIAILPNV